MTRTDDLLAIPAPTHVSASPDGATLAATLVAVAPGAEEVTTSLVAIDVASGEVSTPAWATPGRRVAVFSNAGDRVALLEGEDAAARVVVADARTGAARQLDAAPAPIGPVAWSPDGARIAYAARRYATIDRTRPFRWTRPVLTFDGLGELEDPPQLAVVDLSTGEATWVTDDGWRWGNPRWSPDGRLLAASVFLDPDGEGSDQRVRIVEPGTGVGVRVREAAVPAGHGAITAWLGDGRIAVLVARPDGAWSEAAIFLVDAASGEAERLPAVEGFSLFGDVYGDSPAEAADSSDTVLLGDGDRLVVRAGRGGELAVLALSPDGAVTVLADGPRCASPVAIGGGTVFVSSQRADRPVEIHAIDPSGVERPVTRFGADVGGGPAFRRLRVEGGAGASDAWLAVPQGRGPHPAVVMIHGGPHLAFGEAFSIDAHALLDAGFAVLYGNPRGSSGHGAAYARGVLGDWAEGPASDVLAMLDAAVATGDVDPARVGVTGNSYGGYLSAWLVSTTTRFRAAVIENPVTDLVAMYGTSDIGPSFFPDQFGGPPRERLELYAAQSPLFRAHDCRTPCLFVVGEHDRRCPPSQAFAMHRVLVGVGTTSEILVLPGSSHEGSTYGAPAARRAHDAALVEWMRRYVAGAAD
ncbi:MAG: S9 family peptidase [Actinomycetota bacterium]